MNASLTLKMILSCLLLAIGSFLLPAQNQFDLQFKQYRTTDGLPNNTVRHIFQDSKGFLWLSTINGISRYDGTNFINIHASYQKSDVPSLKENRIYSVLEDHHQCLWVSYSQNHISCYDLRKERFVDFTGDGTYDEPFSERYLAQNGDMWLWHNGKGLLRVTHLPEGGMVSVRYSKEEKSLPDNIIRGIFEDSLQNVWVASYRGVTCIQKGVSKLIDANLQIIAMCSYQNRVYFLEQNGRTFVYENNKIKCVADTPHSVQLHRKEANFVLKDQWITLAHEGFFIYDFKTQETRLQPYPNMSKGQLIVDNYGDYWISNHSGFLHFIQRTTGKVKTFRLFPESMLRLIDFERYHVYHDNQGIIWITTYGNGLFAYSIEHDQLHHIEQGKNGFTGSNFLLNVMVDKSDNVWVGNNNNGLTQIIRPHKGIKRFFPNQQNAMNSGNDVCMIELLDSTLWIGCRDGNLYQYNPHKMHRDYLLFQPTTVQSYQTNIYSVNKDAKGILWVGTRGNGLKIGNKWYTHQEDDSTSLSFNQIFDIHRDHRGRMWIATFGGGLNLAIPQQDGKHYTFRRFFNRNDGQSMFRVIEEDNNGWMWVGSNNGLYVFNPDSLVRNPQSYRLFNRNNGLLCANEILTAHCCRNGNIALGGAGCGIIICKPNADYTQINYEQYTREQGLINDMVVAIQEDSQENLWVATEYGVSHFNPQEESFGNFFSSNYNQGNIYAENSAVLVNAHQLAFGTTYGVSLIDPNVSVTNPNGKLSFTHLVVNGSEVTPQTLDSPLPIGMPYMEDLKLEYYQNSFTIHFSNYSFAPQGQVKYRYLLENYDEDWSLATILNFASYKYLTPGKYVLRVVASDNMGGWSEDEARLSIIIAPPFWKTWWAFLIYILLIGAGLFIALRIFRNFNRLQNRIQVERQLTDHKLVFFTNISHEFRTPLTLIQVANEKLSRMHNLPAELANPLRTMNRGTQRMSRLINQILEFRRMQNGKLSLALEETEIVSFLKDITDSFADLAEQKSIDFHYTPAMDSFLLYLDKNNMDKVVYNLLSNAFKYTPSNGRVECLVFVNTEIHQLIIQVKDNGVGIPKEKQHELFKRFMHTNFSRESLGIGLHLTYELIQTHHGTIRYEENPGGGSVFTVSLPTEKSEYQEQDFLVANQVNVRKEENGLLKEETETQKEVEESDTYKVPLNKQKVLIIDDDADVRRLMVEELGIYFEIDEAEDGIVGLEKAKSIMPDLIVCDVMMPGMNGFDMTRKLRTDFTISHIPVILLTALGTEDKQLQGIESGADAYIAKPFSMKYLVARVMHLIEQRNRLREKFSKEPGDAKPATLCTTSRDKEFAKQFTALIDANLTNGDLSVDDFATRMKMSRTSFYNKVRGITGCSPVEYLRTVRLKKAAEYFLSEENPNVQEVCYRVGFNDPFYFSKCFKAQFGVSPSVYRKNGGVVSGTTDGDEKSVFTEDSNPDD